MIFPTRLLWWADAMTLNQSVILVRPEKASDKALLAHERVHQAQMRRVGTLTFWWRYLTDRTFRLQSEVEAYQTSIAFGASQTGCALLLVDKYHLGITYTDAYRLLEAK